MEDCDSIRKKSLVGCFIDSISQPEMLYHSIEKWFYRILNKYSHSSSSVVSIRAFNIQGNSSSVKRSFNFHFTRCQCSGNRIKENFSFHKWPPKRFSGIYDNLNTFFSSLGKLTEERRRRINKIWFVIIWNNKQSLLSSEARLQQKSSGKEQLKCKIRDNIILLLF